MNCDCHPCIYFLLSGLAKMMSVYRCSTFSASKKWNIQLFNLKSDIGCENQSRSLICYMLLKRSMESQNNGAIGIYRLQDLPIPSKGDRVNRRWVLVECRKLMTTKSRLYDLVSRQ